MSTYLLYLNTDQKVETVEHGIVRGLAVAEIVSCKAKELAKDYAEIQEGDHVIGCSNDGIRWKACLLYTSPSPRDLSTSRMPSSA